MVIKCLECNHKCGAPFNLAFHCSICHEDKIGKCVCVDKTLSGICIKTDCSLKDESGYSPSIDSSSNPSSNPNPRIDPSPSPKVITRCCNRCNYVKPLILIKASIHVEIVLLLKLVVYIALLL